MVHSWLAHIMKQHVTAVSSVTAITTSGVCHAYQIPMHSIQLSI